MSDEPKAKKRKFTKGFKRQIKKRNFLEAGQRGFFATHNFREKDCIRECYNILNDHANKLYGSPEDENKDKEQNFEETTEIDEESSNSEPEDISDTLNKEIETSNNERKKRNKSYRFQVIDTGSSCVFIKTTLPNPVELGHAITEEIAKTQRSQSRYLLRLVPVDNVCKANVSEIVKTAESLIKRDFSKEPKRFSIVFNKRLNNDIKKDEIIKVLADMVSDLNEQHKVDLEKPELSVVLEIIKGLCCISILPNYMKYRKYNILELASKGPYEGRERNNKNDATEEKETLPKTEETKEEKNE